MTSDLAFGQNSGLEVADAEFVRDGFSGGLAVSGEHDDVQPFACEVFQSHGRGRLYGVGDAEQSDERAVRGEIENGLAILAHRLGAGRCIGGDGNVELLHQGSVANRDVTCIDVAENTASRTRLEAFDAMRTKLRRLRRRVRWPHPADARLVLRGWKPTAPDPPHCDCRARRQTPGWDALR